MGRGGWAQDGAPERGVARQGLEADPGWCLLCLLGVKMLVLQEVARGVDGSSSLGSFERPSMLLLMHSSMWSCVGIASFKKESSVS